MNEKKFAFVNVASAMSELLISSGCVKSVCSDAARSEVVAGDMVQLIVLPGRKHHERQAITPFWFRVITPAASWGTPGEARLAAGQTYDLIGDAEIVQFHRENIAQVWPHEVTDTGPEVVEMLRLVGIARSHILDLERAIIALAGGRK